MIGDADFKFVFLKISQPRHRFISLDKHNIFPVIQYEVYHAMRNGDNYKVFGNSYSGIVGVVDFNKAIEENYVLLVDDT